MLIQDPTALAKICDRLRGAPYIAVDTEFLRERTYWPKLCLVQLAHGDTVGAVDPLASELTLGPLLELFDDPNIVKVFHSGSQDMEVIYNLFGRLPKSVFDTQIAAAVLGYGEQPGYASLVSSMLDIELDKASQFTDWSRRPLSTRQLDYALSDVTHLCDVYQLLCDQLAERDRRGWVQEEMAALTREDTYKLDPREQYRRIRLRRPSRRVLGILRELAAWREEIASTRDLPRGWVLKDDSLVEIASHAPHTPQELERVRGLPPRFAHGRDGVALLAVVARAEALPDDQLPELPERRPPGRGHENLVALLKALLKLRSDEHAVAPYLLATRDELDQIASGDSGELRPLVGWRREIFGGDALLLKSGRLALTTENGEVKVVRL